MLEAVEHSEEIAGGKRSDLQRIITAMGAGELMPAANALVSAKIKKAFVKLVVSDIDVFLFFEAQIRRNTAFNSEPGNRNDLPVLDYFYHFRLFALESRGTVEESAIMEMPEACKIEELRLEDNESPDDQSKPDYAHFDTLILSEV